jgi:hypothetical protein
MQKSNTTIGPAFVGCPWQAKIENGEVLCKGFFCFWLIEIVLSRPFRQHCMGEGCEHYHKYQGLLAVIADHAKTIESLQDELRSKQTSQTVVNNAS